MIFQKYFRLPGAVALTAVALTTGCVHPALDDPARRGPFFTPKNHASDVSLGGVRRVVVLPVWAAPGISPESAAALDGVLLEALQRENRFEAVTFTRDDCRRRYLTDALSSSGALPADLMDMLKREFTADAVLFVDLTVFNAYKPLSLGLRGKLATIDGSRLIWTFDNLFATDDPAVANSARHFYVNRDRSAPADLTPAVLQSPTKFAAYAASAMFATLPPVLAPLAKPRAR